MGKIVILDDLTINQIAAGEVIERPASVVKELLENSIDAGATSVSVEVKNGGIKQIKIIDNGSGIAKDDIPFAFERHATSKIRTADDLNSVKSMGFRGEALASIASIAHIELVTKTESDFTGNKVVIEGGEIIQQEETGCQNGTTITISNLFYNTPVRYKFLKKDYTELGYIEDAVKRIALANPGVAIRLSNENKSILKTNGSGELKTTIYSIYGKEITDGLIDVDYTYEDIRVKGVIGKPEIARNNRSYQLFFVNNRFIKDKTLSAGVEQAFKGLLPIGKFGFLVLNLEMDPSKLEIRFQEEQKVFKAVYHAIREGLLKGDLIKNSERTEEYHDYKTIEQTKPVYTPEIIAKPVEKENISKPVVNIESQDDEEPMPQEIENFGKRGINILEQQEIEEKNIENISKIIDENENIDLDATQKFTPPIEFEDEKATNGLFGLFRKKNDQAIEENVENNAIEEIFSYQGNQSNIEEQPIDENVDFNEMYSQTFGVKKDKSETKVEEENTVQSFSEAENISMFEEKEEYKNIPAYTYCGTVFSTYLIVQMGTEMYLIDQHAAHERVLYEEIKKNYYANTERDSQIMLLPDIINLSHKEKALVRENLELFKNAGFMLEEFGENTIRLIGVPSICMDLDTKELFLEILDTIDSVAITAKQEKEDRFIATIACKAAVKAGMNLTPEEVDKLLKKLLVLPNPYTCPHGRPTAIKMSKMDLEKKFFRRK